jgi:uncharacterized protein YjiS (DUF1127 family)
MAYMMQNTITSRSMTERVLRTVSDWLRRNSERRMQRRVMRQTLNEIHGLTARDLSDIGCSRADLISRAYEASRRG